MTATQSIIKVTEQSACFGHRGVTAFTERRVTGVLDTIALNYSYCQVHKPRASKVLWLLGRVTGIQENS